jgi:hypothetical protein
VAHGPAGRPPGGAAIQAAGVAGAALDPAENIWSLLNRPMVNFAAADLDGLVRIVKRKLKKIQDRPT